MTKTIRIGSTVRLKGFPHHKTVVKIERTKEFATKRGSEVEAVEFNTVLSMGEFPFTVFFEGGSAYCFQIYSAE